MRIDSDNLTQNNLIFIFGLLLIYILDFVLKNLLIFKKSNANQGKYYQYELNNIIMMITNNCYF